jgi:hypothetical protein
MDSVVSALQQQLSSIERLAEEGAHPVSDAQVGPHQSERVAGGRITQV